MTTELYWKCVGACLIGNLLHVVAKFLSMKKDHKDGNLQFTFVGYVKDDAWPLFFDFASSFALIYLVDEWIDFDERILEKIKTIFIFIGFTGSYVIMYFFSTAKKKFQKAIDYKTNIADEATGTLGKPTPTK